MRKINKTMGLLFSSWKAMDISSTVFCLDRGAVEMNPFGANFLTLFLLPILSVIFIQITLAYYGEFKSVSVVLGIILGVVGITVINNIIAIITM